jgi:molybdopterin molybdotransferase
MDGVAVSAKALGAGRRQFVLQATQGAGEAPLELASPGHCIEIMTGAVLPRGCDMVVPVEQIRMSGADVLIEAEVLAEPYRWVHRRGSDYRADASLMEPGVLLTPPHAALLASVGLVDVEVSAWPRVSVTSTGDELVEPGVPLSGHQIRCSNDFAMLNALHRMGVEQCQRATVRDDRDALRAHLTSALAEYDLLLISGGVSKGKFDYLPEVLAELGVQRIFHRVKQRPGKPMWFGVSAEGQPVFALPGNPVSAMVCLHRYVLPAILKAAGATRWPSPVVRLQQVPQALESMTRFVPVRIDDPGADGGRAQPLSLNTSGDFFSLSGSDGMVEWPAEAEARLPDAQAHYISWSGP